MNVESKTLSGTLSRALNLGCGYQRLGCPRGNSIVLLILTTALLTFACPTICSGQVQQATAQTENKKQAGKKDEQDEQPVIDTISKIDVVDDQQVRFYIWDGSIIGGEVETKSIHVETDFGSLEIPINRILKIYPGIESLPEFREKFEGLISGLGDPDFEVRENSHKQLIAMGPQIRFLLNRYSGKGNAERKKRMTEIISAIDVEIEESEDDDEEASVRRLIEGDTIETPDFSIVGKIQESNFIVRSKFGKLNISLNDIKKADRTFNVAADQVKKTLTVGAEVFFQRKPVSSRIRVKPGDKIRIRASGVVNWTNWSQTCTPNGMNNQGQYRGIRSGTLCIRVGSEDEIIKVGADGEFVAKKSGVLYLGIAMQDNYLNNNYKWTGEYQVKLRVTPAVE